MDFHRLLAASFLMISLFTMAQQAPQAKPDAELELIASWMAGDFDTFDQVAADEAANAPYKHIRAVMHIVPAAIRGLGDDGSGRAFYVEQAAAEAQDKPYRQRVYFLTRRDGVPVNRLFKIADPARYVGAWCRRELLSSLSLDQLLPEEGCELVWKRAGEGLIKGETGLDGKCKSALRGATHATSRVEMTPVGITSLDQGWDDAGTHKWGPPPGTVGHTFARRDARPESAALEMADEFAQMRAGSDGKPVFWYVEGRVYAVKENGSLEPIKGVAGYNVCRIERVKGTRDCRVLSREIFFSVDPAKGEILLDRPPIQNTVSFTIGVREGRAMAGIAFASNGADMSREVPPAEIRKIASGGATRWFISPVVDATRAERPYWASEAYEFSYPSCDAGKVSKASLIWQRDTENATSGRVHFHTAGGRFTSIEEMASHSPVAKRVADLVKEKYPDFACAP